MARFVKRTEIAAFLNLTPITSSNTSYSWVLVGNGQTSGSISYEATETSETYIVDENATTTIDSYAISMDNEMKCLYGDSVYDYINNLRYTLATGSDAVTQTLLIDKYDYTKDDDVVTYKAQLFDSSISVSSYGGDGGATPTIAYKINFNGTPTQGTATISNGVPTFTSAS